MLSTPALARRQYQFAHLPPVTPLHGCAEERVS
jgi:hypothetical protein